MEDKGKILDTNCTSTADVEASQGAPFKGGVSMAKSSNLQASLTLFKTFLGTGILALPYAFKTAGLGLSMIVLIIVSLLTSYCFFLLIEAANDKVGSQEVSLQKLALEVLGAKGKHAVQVSMMIMQLGCCIGILIFTRSFLNHVLCEFGFDSLCGNLPFNLLFSLALAVPLCMINNMHYFYIPSLAASFFVLAGLAVQMYHNFDLLEENPEAKSALGKNLGEFNLPNLPLFFGIATYSFEGVGVIFSIRNSMEKPQDFPHILKRQMVMLTTIYIVFPTICIIAIGDKLQDIVFFSLPTDNSFYVLVQILYAMSALFTFPIQLFPALKIIENSKALRYRIFDERGKAYNKPLRYGVRLALIGLVFLVAYTANSFHLFLNLLGSCIFTFLGYVLPIWLYQRHFQGRIKTGKKVLNYVIVLVSVVLGSIGFVMSLIKMVTLDEDGSE